MTESGLAVRYTRALYEIGRESAALKDAEEDMIVLGRIFADVSGVREYCLKGEKGRNGKKESLEFCRIAFFPYVGDLTRRLIETAVQNGRITVLPYFPDAYRKVADQEEGVTHVLVDTAFDAGSELTESLKPVLKGLAGENVRVEYRYKPEILGGVKILMNSKLIDMSTAYRLQEMRRWLKQDSI